MTRVRCVAILPNRRSVRSEQILLVFEEILRFQIIFFSWPNRGNVAYIFAHVDIALPLNRHLLKLRLVGKIALLHMPLVCRSKWLAWTGTRLPYAVSAWTSFYTLRTRCSRSAKDRPQLTLRPFTRSHYSWLVSQYSWEGYLGRLA